MVSQHDDRVANAARPSPPEAYRVVERLNEREPAAEVANPDARLPHGISLVIPVYNSEQSLRMIADRIHVVCDGLLRPYELILVNDGSRDRSWSVISELTGAHEWIVGIDLMRNYGQHNALLCGIRAARYDVIVTLDDDGQNPPEEIPVLLRVLEEDHDVVYGTPRRRQHGLWRNLASRVTKWILQGSMGAETAASISAFRAFRTRTRDAFAEYRSPYVSIDVLLTWATTRFTAIPVDHHPRMAGRSNYTVRMLVVHALNMTTGFSNWPLRLASVTGFAFTLFGIVVLAFVLGSYLLRGTVVQGFPFLASIIAIFSGAQLFALGVIGEYLARVHSRTMDQPAYTVRRRHPEVNS